MKLSSIFLGAAMLWAGLAGPGAYYQLQDQPETIRAKVEGKVEVVDDPVHSYRRYDIYTNQGVFNTNHMLNGDQIQPGAAYEFNLRGGQMKFWPPGYTRSIQSVKQIQPPIVQKAPGT